MRRAILISKLSKSRETMLAIADQGVWSMGFFLIGIVVGRFLGAEGLGTFSLGMAVITGIGSFYNSLVVLPASHLGPTLYRSQLREYVGRLLRITLATGLVVTSAAVLTLSVFDFDRVATALVASIAATPAVLGAWLGRRINYIDGKPAAALTGTLLYSSVAIGGIIWLQASDLLSVGSAFFVLGGASLVQILSSVLTSQSKLFAASANLALSQVANQHWRYGRWLLAAGAMTWIGNEGYTVILASVVVNIAAVGGLRAASNLTRISGIFFEAVGLLFVPKLSAVWSDGKSRDFARTVSNLRRAFFLVPSVATVALLFWGEALVTFLYGPAFDGIGFILAILMGGMALNGIAEADGIGLASMGNTRPVFSAHTARAITAPAIGLATAFFLDIYGILAGYLAGQLVKALVMHRGLRHATAKAHPFRSGPVPGTSPTTDRPFHGVDERW